jgi:hypothetical protein
MDKQLVRRATATVLVLVLATALVGCGDDENKGAKACREALELQESLDTLLTLEPEAGADQLASAVSRVRADYQDLADVAKQNFQDQLQALGEQIDELRHAVNADGGDVAAELEDVKDAWTDLVNALHAAASNCDVSSRIG